MYKTDYGLIKVTYFDQKSSAMVRDGQSTTEGRTFFPPLQGCELRVHERAQDLSSVS